MAFKLKEFLAPVACTLFFCAVIIIPTECVKAPIVKRELTVKGKREQLISLGIHPPSLDKCYEGNDNDAVCETKLIDGSEVIVKIETKGSYRVFVFVQKK